MILVTSVSFRGISPTSLINVQRCFREIGRLGSSTRLCMSLAFLQDTAKLRRGFVLGHHYAPSESPAADRWAWCWPLGHKPEAQSETHDRSMKKSLRRLDQFTFSVDVAGVLNGVGEAETATVDPIRCIKCLFTIPRPSMGQQSLILGSSIG